LPLGRPNHLQARQSLVRGSVGHGLYDAGTYPARGLERGTSWLGDQALVLPPPEYCAGRAFSGRTRQRVQNRGVPWGAPAMLALRDIGDWQQAELVRKKTCLVDIVFGDDETQASVAPVVPDGQGNKVEQFEPGLIAYARGGKDIRFNQQASTAGRAAAVRAESIDPAARTVEIVWTTGAIVQRRRWEGWDEVREYDEELIVTAQAVRLERMNAGAPFLDSHDGWSLRSVLGAVEPGSVRIEAGQGTATIRLTSAPDAADTVHRILERTVRHVSVGYRVHRYEITKREGHRELWRAVDWEPMEVSAVAKPADPGAR
ncbi:MAG: phage portal protein, partial [Mangrovicoccus sp.]|nr:phage portal protein [Mangrovicoccus sp.]